MFAHCTFKGTLRGAKLDDGRTVPIYKEDFAQQYDKCGARSGLPQLELRQYKHRKKCCYEFSRLNVHFHFILFGGNYTRSEVDSPPALSEPHG